MVKLKTKSDKHITDNEKRRQSIKEKEKAKLNQSLIIKEALSNASLNSSLSKKIIFNDDQDNDIVIENFDNMKKNGEKKSILFSNSDSEEEAPIIKEKVQFSGKKGFELLNLQSTFGNDERFKIDERFLEDENEEPPTHDDNETEANKDETDPSNEKKKMINILQDVLGEPISVRENEKAKKRKFDMVRYDASKKEHEIYEIKPDPETRSKKKKLRKLMEIDTEEQSKPQVSQEKFYKVSEEIKNSFKEKEEGRQFSLLQTYGVSGIDNEREMEEQKEKEKEVLPEEEVERQRERKKIKVADVKEEKSTAMAQGIWKENFFFEENDPRFKDSLEFINKKNSKEAAEAAENYDQTRRKLKEILRLHMKKQLQKKDPFRNKIGGSNKKQLVYCRPKNRVLASKRKPFKMNSGKKV